MAGRRGDVVVAAGCAVAFVLVYAFAVVSAPGQWLDNFVFVHAQAFGVGPIEDGLPWLARRAAPFVLLVVVLGQAAWALFGHRYRDVAAAGVIVILSTAVSPLLRDLVLVRPDRGGDYAYLYNTFPSTHVTLVVTLVVATWLLASWRPRWLGLLLGGVVVLTMLGNVIGFAHRPSDTVGSLALVGMVVAGVVATSGHDIRWSRRPGNGDAAGDRPRVALIASSFHPYTGGVEQHVRQVAAALRDAGRVIEVWTVDRGEHLGQQEVDGIRVRYLPCPLPARQPGAIGRFVVQLPGVVGAWRRAHREFRPDVLHVHCFGPNGVYALALHRLTGTPLVVTSHGETFADDHGAFDQSALLRGALRSSLSRAAAVTAPSRFVLDDLEASFGFDGGVIVPNGVPLEEPEAGATEEVLQLPRGGPIVLAVGRIERMKGFDLLLDAIARVDLPGVQVVIAGDGAVLDELREQAHRLGMSEDVHLPGRLTEAQVATVMRAADAVVVPSRREAFGIVALEAWRAGTPLIATVHGGMGEFVTDGQDGLLVDPLEVEELAAAVRRVLTDEDAARSLAATAARRVRHFSWQSVAERYMALHANVR